MSAAVGQAAGAAGRPADVVAAVGSAGSGRVTGGVGRSEAGRSWVRRRRVRWPRTPWTARSAREGSCYARGPEPVVGADSLEGWCRWGPVGLNKRPCCRRLAAVRLLMDEVVSTFKRPG